MVLKDLIKMAKIVATLKVMPENIEADLEELKKNIVKLLEKQVKVGRVEEEDVAFGIKALKFIVMADEEKGSLDPIAEKVSKIKGVKSAEITDVTRALG